MGYGQGPIPMNNLARLEFEGRVETVRMGLVRFVGRGRYNSSDQSEVPQWPKSSCLSVALCYWLVALVRFQWTQIPQVE